MWTIEFDERAQRDLAKLDKPIAKRIRRFLEDRIAPILLGLPHAQILHFDDTGIHPIAYEDTPAFQITRHFLNSPDTMLHHLFTEED